MMNILLRTFCNVAQHCVHCSDELVISLFNFFNHDFANTVAFFQDYDVFEPWFMKLGEILFCDSNVMFGFSLVC